MHLAASVLIAGLTFVIAFELWYPGALFSSAGGRQLFLLIAGVDVTLGPLLTTIVFVPGKRGLAFDIVVIVMLQCAALSYGVWVLFQARPAYIAFVKDRFELVRANDIPDAELARAANGPYASLPLAGPKVVGTRMPSDPAEQTRVIISGIGGVDLQSFPQYYVDYDRVRSDARGRSKPLAQLRALNPADGAAIDRIVAASARTEGGLAFLPMRAGRLDLTVILDARTGEVVTVAALRPWNY